MKYCSNKDCGHEQPSGKFCGKCGSAMDEKSISSEPPKLPTPPVTPPKQQDGLDWISSDGSSLSTKPGYLSWNMGEGELARKIKENDLDTYGTGLEGLIIQPGQCALIYCGGELLGEISSGTYSFPKEPPKEVLNARVDGKEGIFTKGWKCVTNFLFGQKQDQRVKEEARKLQTEQVDRYIEALKLGKSFSIFIARKASFELNLTVDQIQTADVRTDLGLLTRCEIVDFVKFYSEFLLDKELITESELQDAFVSRLIAATEQSVLSVGAEDIEANASLREKLIEAFDSSVGGLLKFVSIERVTVKNQEIQELRQRKEELILAEKNLPLLIKSNDFDNRLQLEENRRQLEEAANDEDFKQRMQAINKDGLLREEDLEVFERSIAERAEDHGISRAHALDMVRETNRQEIEAKVRSRELVTLDHELELEKKRRVFKREQEEEDELAEIRQLSRLQELGKQGKQNELELESARKERDHRMDLEKTDQIKDLDVDKIMLLNPNLDRETAMAMLEKQARVAEAQAQSSVSEEAAQREIDRSRETTEMMKEFMENQQRTMVELAGGQAAAKEKEIERIQKSADKQEERLSNVVGNTVDAFKGNAAEATVKGSQSAPAGGEVLYNIAVGKEDKGRHSLTAISEMISSGQFDPQCKVWTKGMSGWKQAVEVPEIADLLDSAPPPIPDDGPPPL
jgi:hypothetical protein